MAVDIKSLLYAGVWREPSPVAAVYPPGNVCTDWSGCGLHGYSTTNFSGPTRLPLYWDRLATSGPHSKRYAAVVDRDSIPLTYSGNLEVRAFACWCIRTPETLAGFAEKCDPSTREGWGLRMANAAGFFEVNGNDPGVGTQHILWPNSTGVFPGNTIMHVAVGWSDRVKAWLNGALVYDSPILAAPIANTTQVMLADARISGNHSGFRWNGMLADVILRDTPWTDAEVAWLANPANDLRAIGSRRPLLSSPHLIGRLS